ncbi:MAG: DNA polymerase, partial [Patescibacteria group bacterium]
TKSFSRIPMVVQAEYCCGDSLVCGRGLEVMMPHVKIRKVRRLFDLQCDLVEIYAKASIRGLRIDLDYHSKLKERFTSECDVLGARFVADYGISAASPQQVTKFVFDELTTDVPVDRGSGDDTLKTILDSLGERDSLSNDETRLRKFIEDVREFRAVSKLLSTYIIGLEKHIVNGRVYPIANIGGARSGRMSYESPNIQNQPIRSEVGRLIRGIFVPDSGCLLECDASKAEMVTAAWLSGDERFIQYLTEYDIYMKVGEDVMRGPVTKRQRDLLWKPVVLANLYLAGSKRLQQAVNIGAEKPEDRITLKQAENLQSSLKRLFPDFDRWKQAQIREIEKNGCVINPFGRLRRGDVRYLFNTLIQSTCSDLIQFAIRNFCKEYGREIVPCDFAFNQHDAIYVDTAPDLIDDVVHAVKCSYSEEALPRGLTFMRLESKPYYERWGQ